MKKLLLITVIIGGLLIAIAGLWVPFYITSLLPARWDTDYWWSFPTMASLVVGGLLIMVGGFALVIWSGVELSESGKYEH